MNTLLWGSWVCSRIRIQRLCSAFASERADCMVLAHRNILALLVPNLRRPDERV